MSDTPSPEWARALWPAGRSDTLLRAIFHASPETARACWREWERSVDFDDVNWSEVRLLPAMARRLRELGEHSSNASRIDGMRRFAWARTQTCLQTVQPLLAAFERAGIPALIIKGGARALCTSLPRRNERATSDIDIAIRRHDLAGALDIIAAEGWTNSWDLPPDRVPGLLRASRHSIPFRKDGLEMVDIHTAALFNNRAVDHDDTMWARALKAELRGTAVLIPHPADQLIVTCTHGLRFQAEPRIRDWVADVCDILAAPGYSAQSGFWDIVVEETRRRALIPPVLACLAYIADRLEGPVPRDVLALLVEGAREPFIAECLGAAQSWDSYDPEMRRAYGAAYRERARNWRDRQGPRAKNAMENAGARPRSRRGWLQRFEVARYRISAAPAAMIRHAYASGRPLQLEIGVPNKRLVSAASAPVADIAVMAQEMNPVELARAPLHDARGGLAWLLRRGRAITFSFDPAIFMAYDLDCLIGEFVLSGTLQRAAEWDDCYDLSYRWRLI